VAADQSVGQQSEERSEEAQEEDDADDVGAGPVGIAEDDVVVRDEEGRSEIFAVVSLL
jgi:hypothetical protein